MMRHVGSALRAARRLSLSLPDDRIAGAAGEGGAGVLLREASS